MASSDIGPRPGPIRWSVLFALIAVLLAGGGLSKCRHDENCHAAKSVLAGPVSVLKDYVIELDRIMSKGRPRAEGAIPTRRMPQEAAMQPPKPAPHFDDTPEGREAYFSTVYATNQWGTGRPGEKPRSGQGSSLENTVKIREGLKWFIDEQEFFDMMDAGCGDMTWMGTFLNTIKIHYTGVDIVPSLVLENQHKHPTLKFLKHDIVSKTLPLSDLILCREVMTHLLADSALKALKLFSASGAKWLVATTFPNTKANSDTSRYKLNMNMYFHWNLEIAPFNLGKPVIYLNDTYAEAPMGIWRLPLWERPSYEVSLNRWADTPENRKELFDKIYKYDHWGTGDDSRPRSGQGSSLPATENLRNALVPFLNEFKVKTMIDVPCGDMHWMKLVLPQVPQVAYTGIDIVEDLVKAHRQKFAYIPNAKFLAADAAIDVLPKVDVIFCREMMQHLLRDTAVAVLQKFKESGSKWLVATTFTTTKDNWDTTALKKKIDVFIYWPWNLEIAPFSLGTPFRFLPDTQPFQPMGLWLLNPDPEDTDPLALEALSLQQSFAAEAAKVKAEEDAARERAKVPLKEDAVMPEWEAEKSGRTELDEAVGQKDQVDELGEPEGDSEELQEAQDEALEAEAEAEAERDVQE